MGASAGEPSGGAAAADADYGAALDQLAETVAGPLVAGGYSFGAAAAVRAARASPRCDGCCSSRRRRRSSRRLRSRRRGERALVLVGEYDTIAPARELEAAFERAPQVELHVIAHADHFFGEGSRASSARLARSGSSRPGSPSSAR